MIFHEDDKIESAKMKTLIVLAPLISLIFAIGRFQADEILSFSIISLIEIILRESNDRRIFSYNEFIDEISYKILSPRIFIPLFAGEYNEFYYLILESVNFFSLRKKKNAFTDWLFLVIFAIITIYGWIDWMSFILLFFSLFSDSLDSLFHSYEICILQTTLCFAAFDISHNFQLMTNPYSPRTILFLAEFALFFLYLSIAITSMFSNTFKIKDKLQKTIWFSVVLFSLIVRFVWPVYALVVHNNPALWFVALFSRSDMLGAYLSGFWATSIIATVWFADFAATRLSLNKIISRKIFHLLVLVMFLPALQTPEALSFTAYALAGVFGIFVLMEYGRNFLLPAIFEPIRRYFDSFILEKEKRKEAYVITSHISLLIATASSIWFYCLIDDTAQKTQFQLLPYFGLLTVGVGDSCAAIFGFNYGKTRWPNSNKTILGTVAAYSSIMTTTILISTWILKTNLDRAEMAVLVLTFLSTALAEAFIEANDNIFLPLYSMSLYINLKSVIKS